MNEEQEGDRRHRKESKAPQPSPVQQVGQYMGHGLTLALATLFFLWLGWLLDERIGTTPLFMILGALLGAAAGFYNLYQDLVIRPREGENGRE